MPEARGRRLLLVRLGFYGLLIAIAVALIATRGPYEGPTPLTGTTDDGTPISIELGRDGRPRRIDLQVTATCPTTGETWAARWWVDDDRVPFHQEGDRLRVREQSTHTFRNGTVARNTFTIDAWVSGDRAEGVITFAEQGDPVEGPDFDCGGGPVRFTAQR